MATEGTPPPPPRAPVRQFTDPKTGRPLAEWWRRALAYLLDVAILAVPFYFVSQFFVLSAFVGLKIPKNCTVNPPAQNCPTEILHTFLPHFLLAFGVLFLLQFVVGGVYFTLLVGSSRGQTVGMMALGIAVRDEQTDSGIGRSRALVRWLVVTALGIAGPLVLIDFLSPLWDRRRQAWHDHAAGSIMVDLN